MRNTRLVAGLSVTALAALGISVCAFSSGDKQKVVENREAKQVESEVADTAQASVEYTGNAFVSSSMLSALQNNVANNTKLREQTGTLMYSEAGMSEALDGYGTYMAAADQTTDASVEALDVALKFVPEGSVIAGYVNLGVSNVSTYLNVREAAGTDNEIVGKMPGGSACEVLGEEDGWYKIQSGEVVGYVAKEYILTGYDANVKAMETMRNVLRVNCDILNVRQEPSLDCPISDRVETGEILEVVEPENNGWYKININNLEGYVSAEYVDSLYTLPVAEKIVKIVVTPQRNEDSDSENDNDYDYDTQGSNADSDSDNESYNSYQTEEGSQTAADLINYAYQFLGNPYVYGGNSLTNGIDCSGFVKQIYAHYGYDMPRTSGSYVGVGETVSYSDAQPGDILVYKYGDGSGHVAIYIGDGQIIHASTPATGICIGNATFTTPYSVQRVLP